MQLWVDVAPLINMPASLTTKAGEKYAAKQQSISFFGAAPQNHPRQLN